MRAPPGPPGRRSPRRSRPSPLLYVRDCAANVGTRLEGVPIISGRANISYHAHFGSVTFFLNLQHKVLTTEVQQSNSCPNSSENNQIIQEESEKDLELELGELNVPDEEQKNSLKKKFSDSVYHS